MDWLNGCPTDHVNPFSGPPTYWLLQLHNGDYIVAQYGQIDGKGVLSDTRTNAIITQRPIRHYQIPKPIMLTQTNQKTASAPYEAGYKAYFEIESTEATDKHAIRLYGEDTKEYSEFWDGNHAAADEAVTCKFCDRQAPGNTAHLHQEGFVCEHCWDERLRASE